MRYLCRKSIILAKLYEKYFAQQITFTQLMKIDWKVSNKTLAKAKKIGEYRKQGKKWEEIALLMGHHRTYCVTLYKHFEREGLYAIS